MGYSQTRDLYSPNGVGALNNDPSLSGRFYESAGSQDQTPDFTYSPTTPNVTTTFTGCSGNVVADVVPRFANGYEELKSLVPQKIFDRSARIFSDSKCTIVEGYAKEGTALAAFQPFIYEPNDEGTSYRNTLFIPNTKNKQASTDEDKTLSRYHEGGAHLEQWSNVLDLMASPYHNASAYQLDPESWVIATVLTERDAYVKGTLMAALNGDPKIREATRTSLLSVEQLEKFCKESPDLQTALDRAGDYVLDKMIFDVDDQPIQTILDHYAHSAQSDYKNADRFSERGVSRYGAPKFVRLGDDAAKIGETLGIKGFKDNFSSLCADISARLPSDVKQWIAEENARWDINRNELKTMRQALADDGVTEEQFYEHARNYKWVNKWRKEDPSPHDTPMLAA